MAQDPLIEPKERGRHDGAEDEFGGSISFRAPKASDDLVGDGERFAATTPPFRICLSARLDGGGALQFNSIEMRGEGFHEIALIQR